MKHLKLGGGHDGSDDSDSHADVNVNKSQPPPAGNKALQPEPAQPAPVAQLAKEEDGPRVGITRQDSQTGEVDEFQDAEG